MTTTEVVRRIVTAEIREAAAVMGNYGPQWKLTMIYPNTGGHTFGQFPMYDWVKRTEGESPPEGMHRLLLERRDLKEGKTDKDENGNPVTVPDFFYRWKLIEYDTHETEDAPSPAPQPAPAPQANGAAPISVKTPFDGPRFGMLFNNAVQILLKNCEIGRIGLESEGLQLHLPVIFKELVTLESQCRAVFDGKAPAQDAASVPESPSEPSNEPPMSTGPPNDYEPPEPDPDPEVDTSGFDELTSASESEPSGGIDFKKLDERRRQEQETPPTPAKHVEGTPFPMPSPQMGQKGFEDYCRKHDIPYGPPIADIAAQIDANDSFTWQAACIYYVKAKAEPQEA